MEKAVFSDVQWHQIFGIIFEWLGIGHYLIVGSGLKDIDRMFVADGIAMRSLVSSEFLSFDNVNKEIIVICHTNTSVPDFISWLSRPINRSSPAIIFVAQDDSGNQSLRVAIEKTLFLAGMRKHSRYYELIDYNSLENEYGIILIPLIPISFELFNVECYSLDRLLMQRDLHMDMLRESGRRSDAHIVRYHIASKLIRTGDTVLDAACGMGYGSEVMQANGVRTRIFGVDCSPFAIDYANAYFGGDKNEIRFTTGTLPSVLADWPDSSFDLVVSFETLEHLENPELFLSEVERILRPGGRIIVSVPNDWSDESGKDPNPFHLHVYTWNDLKKQLEAHFILERCWRQIASGCKSKDKNNTWYPHPRLLESMTLDACDTPIDAEWWIAIGMKSPLKGIGVPYVETLYSGFREAGKLLDFAGSYRNPWLVHGMVDIPFRLQDKNALVQLAEGVIATSPPGSADEGAALAVIGYRLLENNGPFETVNPHIDIIFRYMESADTCLHAQRWRVSLAYLAGRLCVKIGDNPRAEFFFSQCIGLDVVAITPTLATKSVDAALWLGRLRWLQGNMAGALEAWKQGVIEARMSLRDDWREFHGPIDAPLVFPMNDAIEILDKATQCVSLLSIAVEQPDRLAIGIWNISRSSLRSALSRCEDTLKRQMDSICNLERRIKQIDITYSEQIIRIEKSLAQAQELAFNRLEEISQLTNRIGITEQALDQARTLAYQRGDELTALHQRIQKTDEALDQAQKLTYQRGDELTALHQRIQKTDEALEQAQKLSYQRGDELTALHQRIQKTDEALDQAQKLTYQRGDELTALHQRIQKTDEALEQAQKLSYQRGDELTALHQRIQKTDEALDQAQKLTYQRGDELTALHQRIQKTDEALEQAQKLSYQRGDELTALHQRIQKTDEALDQAQKLTYQRGDELTALHQRIQKTDEALEQAQKLALTRMSDIIKLNEKVSLIEEAFSQAQQLALTRLDELKEIHSILTIKRHPVEKVQTSSIKETETISLLKFIINEHDKYKAFSTSEIQSLNQKITILESQLFKIQNSPLWRVARFFRLIKIKSA